MSNPYEAPDSESCLTATSTQLAARNQGPLCALGYGVAIVALYSLLFIGLTDAANLPSSLVSAQLAGNLAAFSVGLAAGATFGKSAWYAALWASLLPTVLAFFFAITVHNGQLSSLATSAMQLTLVASTYVGLRLGTRKQEIRQRHAASSV